MTFNNYTQKSLEAVQSAQNIAVQHSNQQLEQIHLLVALLQQDGGLTPQPLRKMGITTESLEAAAKAEVQKLPAVTGSREADRFYISPAMDATFRTAEQQAQRMKDNYVCVEHLLLALIEAAEGSVKSLFEIYRIPWM